MHSGSDMRVHNGVTVANDAGYQYPPAPPPYTAVAGPPHVVYAPNIAPGAMITPTVVSMPPVGPAPTVIVCPSCKADVITRVEHKSTTKTHLMALLICLFFWPCVCLPYCLDSCQNAEHFCPNCGCYIGTYTH